MPPDMLIVFSQAKNEIALLPILDAGAEAPGRRWASALPSRRDSRCLWAERGREIRV
jgi:hypothetical protein